VKELIDILFSIVNGPLTILMIGLIIYWLLTTFGLFDMDSFDIDVDLDIDIDADVDLGTDVIIDDFSGARGEDVIREQKRKKLSPFEVFLVYFHFVEVPFMMAFTFYIFIWWILTVFFTEMLGIEHSVFGYIVLFAFLIPSLFIMKIITYPLKKLMKHFNPKGVENLQIVGRIGQSITKITHNKLGQVQLVLDESPIRINCMAINKDQIIEEKTEVLVIKKSADSKYYLIDFNH